MAFTKAQAAWNSGMDDKEAEARGFKRDFIAFREKYGCACIPLSDVLRRRPPTEKELNTLVGQGKMTYGQWKGITGPGQQLREMVKQIRAEREMAKQTRKPVTDIVCGGGPCPT